MIILKERYILCNLSLLFFIFIQTKQGKPFYPKTLKPQPMKNYLQFIVAFALSCLLVNLPAFAQKRENQHLSGFNGVKASSGVNVYLSKGNTESVEIEAEEEVFQYIVAEIDGNNTLVIKIDNSSKRWFKKTGEVNVYVSFTELDNIQLSGGTDVTGEGVLEFNNLRISSSGGSDLRLNLQVNELEVKCSGGAYVVLAGSAAYFEGTASGGSDIKAKDLEAEVAEVSASGAADIHISASQALKATASGASDIVYYGNPEKVNVQSSGASDITKR
jgi:hypothetical protein